MPSSGAFWRIRRHPRAAPLDKEEPRTQYMRSSGYPVSAKSALIEYSEIRLRQEIYSLLYES
jgi:hypothetical protein